MANRLEELRKRAGLSQRDLANRAIVARASISHMELERYGIGRKTAEKVVAVLNKQLGETYEIWDVFPEHFTPPEEGEPHD